MIFVVLMFDWEDQNGSLDQMEKLKFEKSAQFSRGDTQIRWSGFHHTGIPIVLFEELHISRLKFELRESLVRNSKLNRKNRLNC